METTRRHLLRSTLLAAALPRVEAQDPLALPAAPEAYSAVALEACVPSTFVDHRGWIIPPADRDALQARDAAGGPSPPPAADGA